MPFRKINPTGNAYSQAFEVGPVQRLLFVSGQVAEDETGHVPQTFPEQCRLAWSNVKRQLKAADMTLEHLVKVTVFLSDRQYREQNAAIRREILGEHQPALTIIITGIYETYWLLEIEAIAVETHEPLKPTTPI